MSSPQSVTRVIHILEALCASAEPLSLAQLSRALGAPKSSIAALLQGLAAADFVLPADGVYRLGPRAFGIGSALVEARRRLQSSDLIRSGMRALAERSGETVLFAVRDSSTGTITYVDAIESRNAIRFAVSIGDRRPLYCTAGGRVLLAASPEADVRTYLKRLQPQPLTASTVIDKPGIAQAISAARDSGVAQTIDQTSEGAAGTAAAIREASGAVIGALIVAAPSSRVQRRGDELARMVLDAADGISATLGFRRADSGAASAAKRRGASLKTKS